MLAASMTNDAHKNNANLLMLIINNLYNDYHTSSAHQHAKLMFLILDNNSILENK